MTVEMLAHLTFKKLKMHKKLMYLWRQVTPIYLNERIRTAKTEEHRSILFGTVGHFQLLMYNFFHDYT